MRRYIVFIGLSLLCAFVLMACSGNGQGNNEAVDLEDNVENESANNESEEENVNAADEDQEISGKVILDEDENKIRLEAETNLLEGTRVEAILEKAYGEVDISLEVLTEESTEVKSDGTATLDYVLEDEDFFEDYKGEDFQFIVTFKSNSSDEELVDAYGADGENFSGPFVYRDNSSIIEQQELLVPMNIRIGDSEAEYSIETPEREELPDDYGDTEVWIDAEVADHDHRFLYVDGKSNILEGAAIQGKYYGEDDTIFYDGFLTKSYVEPDGTFRLPIKYDSITQDGHVEISVESMYAHRADKDVHDTYGEGFKDLTGDDVEEDGDRQKVFLTIDADGMDIDIPDDSFATEDDGEVKIQVPDDVLFDFDKSDLKSDAKDTLEEVIEILEGLEDGTEVKINGHTDTEGEADYNLDLSEKRAKEVQSYLSKNGDLDQLNIEKKGYGETDPIASNANDEGRERNRRVEIVIEGQHKDS